MADAERCNANARVLVIEDEEPLRMALVDALRAEGYRVSEAADGDSGLDMALRDGPEIVLLDLMLPGRDGFSVLREIRRDRLQSAVIILSARGEEWDRIHGFEVGADDYLVKPFSTRELLVRMQALGARLAGGAPGVSDGDGRLTLGEVVVDFAAYRAERGTERTGLSRRELELLRFLVAHEGEVLARERILDEVWGHEEHPTTRTIDMHVLKLRRKLEVDPEQPRYLQTVRGVGYRFSRRPGGESRR